VVREAVVRRARPRCRSTAIALVGLVVWGLAHPPASDAIIAGHRRQDPPHAAVATGGNSSNLDEVSTALIRSQALLNAARSDLAAAQSRLTGLRVQVQTARQVETRVDLRLGRAVVRLRTARVDVSRGRADVATARATLTGYAVSTYSYGGIDASMLSLTTGLTSPEQLMNRLQDSDVMLNAQAVDLEQLEALQVLLSLTEQRMHTTKDAVSRQRRHARDNLARSRRLEAAAAATESTITARVSTLQADRDRLASAKTTELARISTMRSGTTVFGNPGYLSYPVSSTYVTSPYGMRMHPILHVWKLHDGTDFAAACGSPVHAAAAGTITAEYFNRGYGNRVIMSNGHVDGIDLGTSYNHLSRLVARVGQHVARGQLIAYAGMTGYATGCHLHFMVYVGGATVDPMTWL
jgi:murein DD-endopeptidase MepM/ murein hydrolase activator NlpD